MVKISKATQKEALTEEWRAFTHQHYGSGTRWIEKHYRFKAEENGKIVGTIDGRYEPGVLHIAALMVKEDTRGKGIGTMLINKAEEFGKKRGAHRTWLSTGVGWPSGIFYEKLGFTIMAHLPDFYFHKDFVIYTRLIN